MGLNPGDDLDIKDANYSNSGNAVQWGSEKNENTEVIVLGVKPEGYSYFIEETRRNIDNVYIKDLYILDSVLYSIFKIKLEDPVFSPEHRVEIISEGRKRSLKFRYTIKRSNTDTISSKWDKLKNNK